jgi:hypothetical protein
VPGAGLAVVLLVALVWVGEPAMAQCRMCRTALESPEGAALGQAFRRAILLLLPVPFAAASLIMLLIRSAWRRQGPPIVEHVDPPAPTGRD